MEKNIILDYEQVEQKLAELVEKSKKSQMKITQQKDIGVTSCGLPIRHYTIGTGEKHIVISGAMHGSEIISTDFVLHVMKEIVNENENFKFLLNNEYTLHFVPMLNPEGYLITTTAIRKKIPREMSKEEMEKICNEYYQEYKKDDIEAKMRVGEDHKSLKRHQKMFMDVTWEDIPDKYLQVKMKLKELYEKYEIPLGTMVTWSANADGVDINANSEYNESIKKIENGEDLFMPFRHNNIKYSQPGPINYPGKEKANETKAMDTLLESLKEEIFAYFNYHGTGGLLYQRPAKVPENLKSIEIDLNKKSLRNYLLSKLYKGETYKDASKKSDPNFQYDIGISESEVSTVNDVYRIMYPADILVELSGMGGNPIAPYGDLNGNYRNLIESNTKALSKAIQIIDLSNKVADAAYGNIQKLKCNDKITDKMLEQYNILDLIYIEFVKGIDRLINKEQKGAEGRE